MSSRFSRKTGMREWPFSMAAVLTWSRDRPAGMPWDVGAGGHDFGDGGVGEFDDAFDHLALGVVEGFFFVVLFDGIEDLLGEVFVFFEVDA